MPSLPGPIGKTGDERLGPVKVAERDGRIDRDDPRLGDAIVVRAEVPGGRDGRLGGLPRARVVSRRRCA